MRQRTLVKARDTRYGDIIFFRPISAFGRVVCAADNLRAKRGRSSPFSHTASVLWNIGGRVVFIESVAWLGVRIGVLDTRLNNFVIARPSAEPRPIEETLDMVGVPYDYGRIRHLLVRYMLNIKPSWDDNGRVICAELSNCVTQIVPEGEATPRTLWWAC